MTQPGQWKPGDVALFKPPFGCAKAGQWLRVTLREGVLCGVVRPHGCKVPGCRVWPRAETAADGPYRNVPECELAEAPALPTIPPATITPQSQPYRYPVHSHTTAATSQHHSRLPYSDSDDEP